MLAPDVEHEPQFGVITRHNVLRKPEQDTNMVLCDLGSVV